jgi:hypothetical protein
MQQTAPKEITSKGFCFTTDANVHHPTVPIPTKFADFTPRGRHDLPPLIRVSSKRNNLDLNLDLSYFGESPKEPQKFFYEPVKPKKAHVLFSSMNKFQLSGVMDRYNSGLLKMIKQESDQEMNLTHLKVEVKSVISHMPNDNVSVVTSHGKLENRQSVQLSVSGGGGQADSPHSILKAGYKRRIRYPRVKSRRASEGLEQPSQRVAVAEANKMNANDPEIQKLA